MSDRDRLLAIYDEQLRTDAETRGAVTVVRHGPLHLATHPRGRGHITYRSLGAPDEASVRRLVAAAVEHYRATPGVTEVEWKTRGHDAAPGLHDALVQHGFTAGEPESIMLGEAAGLAVEVPLPEGVTLRRVTGESDVRAASELQDATFGTPGSEDGTRALVRRLARDDGIELWVAEANGVVVSAGRLEVVPGTAFAGIWGGVTRPQWRGRGIYRALTAARARSALRHGATLIHSDSTGYSRPILERSELVAASTTTPYSWRP